MPFSRKTIVRLAEVMNNAFTHADLNTLFFEFEAETADTAGNKLSRSMALLKAVATRPPAQAANEALTELVEPFVNRFQETLPASTRHWRLTGSCLRTATSVQLPPAPPRLHRRSARSRRSWQTGGST